MGRHQAAGRRRGFAAWPIAVALVVLGIAGGIALAFGLSSKSDKQASCRERATVTVLASDAVAGVLRNAAKGFNGSTPTLRNTCVSISVTELSAKDAISSLSSSWDQRSDPAPAAWFAASHAQVLTLETTKAELTSGRSSDPIATSPVVLAVRAVDAAALSTSSWSQLAAKLPAGTLRGADGKPLTLSAPPAQDNVGTLLAAASVAADGKPTLAAEQVGTARSALAKLLSADLQVPANTQAALKRLADPTGPARLVPVLESDLISFNVANQSNLVAAHPSGPTAALELFGVPLTAPWVEPVAKDTVEAFRGYLRSADGAAVLTEAGLRVRGAQQPTRGGIDLSVPVTALRIDTMEALNQLAAINAESAPSTSTAVPSVSPPVSPAPAASPTVSPASSAAATPTAPASSAPASSTPVSTPSSTPSSAPSTVAAPTSTPAVAPATLIVTDLSASWSKSVNAGPAIDVLRTALQTATTEAAGRQIGLAVANSGLDGGYAQVVAFGTQVDPSRPTVMKAAIAALSPTGDSRLYGAITTALTSVNSQANAQRPVRVILIADTVDQTPDTPRSAVLQAVAAAVAGNPHISLTVIGVGNSVTVSALTAIADAGNGQYVPSTYAQLSAKLTAAVTG